MATQLYVKSEYSLLSSMCRIADTVLKCKELGFDSLAIVDKNILVASKELKEECEKNNIKPIFAMEVDLYIGDIKYPLCLYARNTIGYKNLIKISSFVSCDDSSHIDKTYLNEHKEGLFIVFESDNSPLNEYIKTDELDNKIDELINDFGNEILFGICDNNIQFNRINNDLLKEHLQAKNVKTLAISRTYYLNKEDAYECEILRCIGSDDDSLISEKNIEQTRYLLSTNEMNNLYDSKDIVNADILAKNCNVGFNFKTTLPDFPTPNNADPNEYLKSLAIKCLSVRFNGNVPREYEQRLNYELKVIIDMGFANYFLIVYDYIKYAKRSGYQVGVGRGSSAGSLVSYVLGITEVDPMKYGLLFERFLNPERISMPDIDTDFPDDKRNDVVRYVKEKYGDDHVAYILTFGTFKAKQSLRDVAKVMGFSNSSINAVMNTIPKNSNDSLEVLYNELPRFKRVINISEENRKLYNTALKIENLPRHYTIHPAGVVFSKDSLDEVIPLIKTDSQLRAVQFDAKYLEDMGLIKMDFLSLKNLSVIYEISEQIRKDLDSSFDIRKIALDDSKTYDLISNGDLLGVFQLEREGMRKVAKKMKPNHFEELGILLALYRPGPMQNIDQFIQNKANPNNIKYLSKDLEPILKETYGIIVYQEQIMMIARKFAGFSYGKADILRRAMSKKHADELASLQNEFINGCIKNGYDKTIATTIYDYILKFANYGFNKSHSCVYSVISYYEAYLKANYPLYFYKAVLNETVGDEFKTFNYIREYSSRGGKFSKVDINTSSNVYIIKDNSLVLPFSIIKDVGPSACEKILEERSKGPFVNYLDAVVRLSNNGVNRAAIENLISAGAFDCFEYNRYSKLMSLETTLAYASVHKNYSGPDSVGQDAPSINQVGENLDICAEKEKKVLGFYFTYNPIKAIKTKYNINTLSISDLLSKNGPVEGFGLVKRLHVHKTKTGDEMEFITVDDGYSTCSLALMPNIYSNYKEAIHEGDYLYFKGNHDREDSVNVKGLKVYQK